MDPNSTPPAPSSPSPARPQDELPPAPKRFKSEEPAPADAGAKHAHGWPDEAWIKDEGTGEKQSGGLPPAATANGLSTGVSEEQCKLGESNESGQSTKLSSGKRKQAEPRKLSPGQQGGLSLPQHPAYPGAVVPPSASAADDHDSDSSDGGSDSSSSSDDGDQSALLAALLQGGLQGEHADFIRAYIARHTDLLDEVSAVPCCPCMSRFVLF